jgi:nucleoside-diphosphate-sugar epimerase
LQKIAITGGTGFVGSNLTNWFLSSGYEVHLILRENSDLSKVDTSNKGLKVFFYKNNIDELQAFLMSNKPSCVIHLASRFIAEHESHQIDELIQSNILFGCQLLEAMHRAGIKCFINTGTSWQHFQNSSFNPVSLYAATKQSYEALIDYYVRAENFKVITLKLFDTYGENDERPKLINLLYQFAKNRSELSLTPGDQKMNLVHITDVCCAYSKALDLVLNKRKSCHLKYKVASPNAYSIKEIIILFESLSGMKINVVWGGKPYRKREVMEPWNGGVLLPNWSAKITLHEGLLRYITKHNP